MKQTNRYEAFLLRLWQPSSSELDSDSWIGEVEHIQSGEVHLLNDWMEISLLLQQIINSDHIQNSEDNYNE